ncbi:substance-K receptor-like [Babylonia areolata]|uniref:substance-K receptor-like n=1 Tax=Babylonia areolata TaxID=304850 RepID=UPI003FCF89A3
MTSTTRPSYTEGLRAMASSPSYIPGTSTANGLAEHESWTGTSDLDPSIRDWAGSLQQNSGSFQSLDYSNLSAFNASFNVSGGLNASSGNETETLFLSEGAKAGLIVLYTLTTLLSISGNILVVLVFVRGRRCRTDIRPFLINLAVADLVMALFCMPFTFTFVMLRNWVFSKPMCPLVLFMQHLSVSASVFTNVAIGSDRFLVVMFPLKSRVTTARARYVLGSIWLLAVGLSSVQLAVGRAQDGQDGVVRCDEVWEPEGARRIFTMFVLFITYIIPLTILAVTYSIVGVLLWRRSTPGNADHQRDLHQLQAKRKVVKMLILVVTIFALCWLPLHTFFLVIDFNPEVVNYHSLDEERVMTGVYYAVHWLAMSNSFANPFIYSFTNDSFRADLAYIFYVVFPFCKCLKKMAYRKLSVMSIRDNRLHSTIRPSPVHSPYPGGARPSSAKHPDAQKHLRLYNGNRVYLTLGQRNSPAEEHKSFLSPRAAPMGRRSPSCDRTSAKTTSTYV